jgi:hypothetical protein
MGRAQRRAKSREEAKRERGSKGSAREPSGETTPPRIAGAGREAQGETARRIYRTGGKPAQSGPKKGRRVNEKRLKWREGRQ